MTVRHRFARFSSLIVGLLALTTFHGTARGQARLSYAGGLGTPLTVTLAQPITYVVTTAYAANSGPLFDFQGAGNYFSTSAFFSGNITYTINGGAPQAVNTFQSNVSSGAVSSTDILFFGTFNAIPAGATVVLSAGSMTTQSNFFSNRPLDQTVPTFLTTSAGAVQSGPGISPAPEPSAWAVLLAGVGLLAVTWRWRGAAARSR